MASHEYLRFMLKTPEGYLTENGATEDICNENILILNVCQIGGPFADRSTSIRKFLQFSTADFPVGKCILMWYCCKYATSYSCDGCSRRSNCAFWNNRKECMFCGLEESPS